MIIINKEKTYIEIKKSYYELELIYKHTTPNYIKYFISVNLAFYIAQSFKELVQELKSSEYVTYEYKDSYVVFRLTILGQFALI